MKKQSGIIIYSATDLIHYLASPFASWLDRYYLENPEAKAGMRTVGISATFPFAKNFRAAKPISNSSFVIPQAPPAPPG